MNNDGLRGFADMTRLLVDAMPVHCCTYASDGPTEIKIRNDTHRGGAHIQSGLPARGLGQ